jgi:Dolichyl-phosphate-mannose-protein mannosyltransferase
LTHVFNSSASYRTLTDSATERAGLRGELWAVGCGAALLSLIALVYCYTHGLLLLYGDAVAHLHIARRIFDSLNPGFRQLGSVWLPLPHLLLVPFVQRMEWWQNGLAGAWPSMACYVAGCLGIYRLARLWMAPGGAVVAVAFYALNPGLLYMQTTAMTEPLFLAEMIWGALLVAEHGRALDRGRQRRARRTLIGAGLVLVAAVYTRYDGWIYASFAWLVVLWGMVRGQRWREPVGGAFVLFTAMLMAAPACWLLYNAKQFGDPLDFIRGPYSAKAIDARTSQPGAAHYPGWRSMWVAELHFMKAAELGAVLPLWTDRLLLVVVAGTIAAVAWRPRKGLLAALLLWIPLPFYMYSIAYGSVPIFIPIWWPFSWYNTRYGMEMLPAFALFAGFLAAALLEAIRDGRPRAWRWALGAMLAVIAGNSALVLRARPLVLQEAYANSKTRIPFERELAAVLASLPPQDRIMMYTSDHIGAVQRAGIVLRRTLNEGDYFQWHDGLRDPAKAAQWVVATDGDAVAAAVKAMPDGLELVDVVCSTGQPCARVYRSHAYALGRD